MAVLGVSTAQSGITSNYPQVKQALDAYVKVRNQSTYASVLKKMQDIAYTAAEYTEFSDPKKIENSLLNLPNKGAGGTGKFVGLYKVINWQRKLTGQHPLGGGRPRTRFLTRPGGMEVIEKKSKAKYADKTKRMAGKSKGFIKRRTFSSKWLRIGWALASNKLGKPFKRGDFGPATMERLSGKKYGGGAEIKIFGAGKYAFEIYNGVGIFDHRYATKDTIKLPIRPANQIAYARKIQEAGLQRAVSVQIADMYKKVSEKILTIWNGGYKVKLEQIKPL
jgi:hypothetical protein